MKTTSLGRSTAVEMPEDSTGSRGSTASQTIRRRQVSPLMPSPRLPPKTTSRAPGAALPTTRARVSPPSRQTPLLIQRSMPEIPAVLAKIVNESEVASFPYHRDVTTAFRPSQELASLVAEQVWPRPDDHAGNGRATGLLPDEAVDKPAGTLVDTRTGAVMSFLVNEERKEVVAVFGGTSSGPFVGSPMELIVRNAGISVPQWQANIQASFPGELPESYDQADAAVKTLAAEIQTREYAGYSLRTAGHSKGAAEATYATLRNSTTKAPVPASGFSSSHLSESLIDRAPVENQDPRNVHNLVNHYSVSTDVVPRLAQLPLLGIKGVGTEFRFPPSSKVGVDPLSAHVYYREHLKSFAEEHPEKHSEIPDADAQDTASSDASRGT